MSAVMVVVLAARSYAHEFCTGEGATQLLVDLHLKKNSNRRHDHLASVMIEI
jgi:hypothetical protein